MKIGIIVFPGSNCDRDVRWATEGCLGISTNFLWHETTELDCYDAIVIPGGFSYGDYLRCGAIARFAPVLKSLISFVDKGGKVLGICNGFQILTELGLLQGALTRNEKLHFICDRANLSVSSTKSFWMKHLNKNECIDLPIAHGEGRYQCSPDVLKKLQDDDSVAFRYTTNPNGSIDDIAGITNKKGNVLGMMPHPERACDDSLGNIDGKSILKSLLS
tara:strand:+ start:638 stop:1291 length:654 start_codon:yes stop_codon:yes gene_type:complete